MSVGGSSSIGSLQLWILTSLSESRWPLSILRSTDPGLVMNYRLPKAGSQALTDAVERLFDRELLFAERGKQQLRWEGRKELDSWIDSTEDYPNTIHFGLTPTGGLLWERACQADWSRYLDSLGGSGPWGEGSEDYLCTYHFEGSTRQRVLEYSRGYESVLSYVRLRERWKELSPWRATYWKTLSGGFRLTGRFRHVPLNSWPTPRRWPPGFKDFTRWYQDPVHPDDG